MKYMEDVGSDIVSATEGVGVGSLGEEFCFPSE